MERVHKYWAMSSVSLLQYHKILTVYWEVCTASCKYLINEWMTGCHRNHEFLEPPAPAATCQSAAQGSLSNYLTPPPEVQHPLASLYQSRDTGLQVVPG